jgi:4-diphosphocytidyl-2-C-methyl-D-erythritol kinase
MAWVASTFAKAKINLFLHVLSRRPDGYHELESLVSFAAIGDKVTLVAGSQFSLSITGPEAQALSEDDANSIAKATDELKRRVPGLITGAFHLRKALPIASGIGGGSADAAAALRLLARLNRLSLTSDAIREAAKSTGADVPVCLENCPRHFSGIGDILGAPIAHPKLAAVLVNPRIPVPTQVIFKALNLAPGESHTAQTDTTPIGRHRTDFSLEDLARCRNDLEPPASTETPVIAAIQTLFRADKTCLLSRMSGSGATVFGLYSTRRQAAEAARRIRLAHPSYWVVDTVFG